MFGGQPQTSSLGTVILSLFQTILRHPPVLCLAGQIAAIQSKIKWKWFTYVEGASGIQGYTVRQSKSVYRLKVRGDHRHYNHLCVIATVLFTFLRKFFLRVFRINWQPNFFPLYPTSLRLLTICGLPKKVAVHFNILSNIFMNDEKLVMGTS